MNDSKHAKEQDPLEIGYKRYCWTIAIASILTWSAFILVILKLDPYEATGKALSLFSISLFFALIGTFTLLGCWIRHLLGEEKDAKYHALSVSLRQGVLLSVCTLLCVTFLILGVLTWWNGLLIVAIAVLLEAYLTSRG